MKNLSLDFNNTVFKKAQVRPGLPHWRCQCRRRAAAAPLVNAKPTLYALSFPPVY